MIHIRSTLPLALGLLAMSSTALAQTVPSGAVPQVPRSTSPNIGTAGVVSIQQGGGTLGPGNLILNGDFENYSGGTCDSNLSNAQFSTMMASTTGFGIAEEIDVYANPPCYGLPAVSGAIKIAIHRQSATSGGAADAFSFDLLSPLIAGNSYTISFLAESDSAFTTALGQVQIGVSTSSTAFGVLVYTGASTTLDTWEAFTATFVAPISASYLTVNQNQFDAWSHIDDFSLVEEGVGTKYCTANSNSTGAPADLSGGGSTSSAAGDLMLTSAPVPNQSSIFFHGMNQAQFAFGNGFMCTTGDIARGAVVMGMANVATYTYNNSDAKHSLAGFIGSTRNFQHWYRDPAAGGAAFNLSNAMAITIAP